MDPDHSEGTGAVCAEDGVDGNRSSAIGRSARLSRRLCPGAALLAGYDAQKASAPQRALRQTKYRHNADDPDRSKNDPGTKKAERRRSAF